MSALVVSSTAAKTKAALFLVEYAKNTADADGSFAKTADGTNCKTALKGAPENPNSATT